MRSPYVMFMPLVYPTGPSTIILRLVARLFPYLGPDARNVAYPIKDVCTSGNPPHMDFPLPFNPALSYDLLKTRSWANSIFSTPAGIRLDASIREFNPAEF